jgi:hypothetical protein
MVKSQKLSEPKWGFVNYISIWGTSIYGDLLIPTKAQILWTFQGEKQLGPHPGVKASLATAQADDMGM